MVTSSKMDWTLQICGVQQISFVFLKLYTNLNIHNKNIKGLSAVNFVIDYISPKIFSTARALII